MKMEEDEDEVSKSILGWNSKAILKPQKFATSQSYFFNDL